MAMTKSEALEAIPAVERADFRATASVIKSLVDGDFDPQSAPRASTVTIALAAGAANTMGITVTCKDAAGNTVPGVHQLEIWMSENSGGAGLTGDTYSGDLTATTGAILSAHTAKKHWSVATASTGIFAASLVDTAKPADQRVAVKSPLGAAVVVSAASGTSWG